MSFYVYQLVESHILSNTLINLSIKSHRYRLDHLSLSINK